MVPELIVGLALLGGGIAMIVLGRPRQGVERAFVRIWIAFVAYVMTAMASIVFGIAALIDVFRGGGALP
jgi:hypothetical protein